MKITTKEIYGLNNYREKEFVINLEKNLDDSSKINYVFAGNASGKSSMTKFFKNISSKTDYKKVFEYSDSDDWIFKIDDEDEYEYSSSSNVKDNQFNPKYNYFIYDKMMRRNVIYIESNSSTNPDDSVLLGEEIVELEKNKKDNNDIVSQIAKDSKKH